MWTAADKQMVVEKVDEATARLANVKAIAQAAGPVFQAQGLLEEAQKLIGDAMFGVGRASD